jgi:ABC-type uncharacterized transport system permease subunit
MVQRSHIRQTELLSWIRHDLELFSATTRIQTMSSSESNDNEYWNFVRMAILFSANHGCVVACLSLATARLGTAGAYSSGILYVVVMWLVPQASGNDA